jgi:hypothetical protein
MLAKLYFSAVFEKIHEAYVNNSYLGLLNGCIAKVDKRRLLSISSNPDEIEFDDLGQSLLDYCRTVDMPDMSSLVGKVTAYMQVIPAIDDGDVLRVYLSADLLKILSERGCGLDIHGQTSLPARR